MVCYPKYLNYILDSNLNLEVLNLARMYGMFGYLEKKCQNDDLLNILVSLSKIFYQKSVLNLKINKINIFFIK